MAITTRLVGKLGGVKPVTHSVTISAGPTMVGDGVVVTGPTLLVCAIQPGCYTTIVDSANPGQATQILDGSTVVDAGTWWFFASGLPGTYSVTTLVMPL